VLRLSTDELTVLALRLRPYLTSPRPAWAEIVDAADWLRGGPWRVAVALGRGLPFDGARAGGNRDRDRVGQAGGAFPVDTGRVFPRHDGEGEGWRAQPRRDSLGFASGRGVGSPSRLSHPANASCTGMRDQTWDLTGPRVQSNGDRPERQMAAFFVTSRPNPLWDRSWRGRLA
jgi:hypothetical protein